MAAFSSADASNQVATSRNGTTSVCPGLTGKPSRIANARAFCATQSELGRWEKTDVTGSSPS